MNIEVIKWDIYEVKTKETPINGVMLRGRIRKLCLVSNINVLVENTQDIEKSVRFAVIAKEDPSEIVDYLHKILTYQTFYYLTSQPIRMAYESIP